MGVTVSYNPDILSCLANLSNDEVFTPPELVNRILDMLPSELWSNPDTRVLDPCSKSGVFLREIAKRMIEGEKNVIPDLQERIDHIFHKQLYGIAITELTSLLSRRSLYCSKMANGQYSVSQFKTPGGNIIYRKRQHTWDGDKCIYCGASKAEYNRSSDLESYAYEFIHLTDKETKELSDMHFDLIIGNPPYQLSTGGSKSQAIPLYDKFVEQAMKLNPKYLVMIIPDRWFSGGFGLNDFRNMMLNDAKLEELIIYPLASDCFPGVDVPGGICYFLWNRDYNGICNVTVNSKGKTSILRRPLLEKGCDVFIKYNEAIPILRKVINSPDFNSIEPAISAQKPFGFGTSFIGKKTKSEIKLIGRNKTISYIEKEDVTTNVSYIDKYKVFVSASYGERIADNFYVLGKPFIGEPGTVCSETYIFFSCVSSEEECKNLMSYISTKFFRFMVLLKKPTQHTLRKVYSFVPLQNFSKPWTDEELYKKYDLTDDEIAFIESMIRPMDLSNDKEGGSV